MALKIVTKFVVTFAVVVGIAMPTPVRASSPVDMFAVRTNLLLPLLNVGAEVPMGSRWSTGIDYYYPWAWRKSNHKNCFQLTFVSAEARYWLGDRSNKAKLTGHSVAAFGAWGYYDIEHDWHGHQGHGWSAGVDYLFAKTIAKGKLHLEFQVALGAVWSPGVQCYNVHVSGGKAFREKGHKKNWSYFGPTKVAVTLAFPINLNRKSKEK